MLLWFFFEHYSVGLAFASKLAYLSHYQPYSVFSLNINSIYTAHSSNISQGCNEVYP